MNNATAALAMFYTGARILAEEQGPDALLQRLEMVRGWLERENNGCLSPCGMPGGAASGR
jgi:hypothetical protein